MPYLQHTSKNGITYSNITISSFDEIRFPEGIRKEIKKVKTSTGGSVFLFENQRFTMEDMISYFKPDSVKNRELFRYALQCLKVEEQTIYEPYIIEKDNHLYFPDIKDIYSGQCTEYCVNINHEWKIHEKKKDTSLKTSKEVKHTWKTQIKW